MGGRAKKKISKFKSGRRAGISTYFLPSDPPLCMVCVCVLRRRAAVFCPSPVVFIRLFFAFWNPFASSAPARLTTFPNETTDRRVHLVRLFPFLLHAANGRVLDAKTVHNCSAVRSTATLSAVRTVQFVSATGGWGETGADTRLR